MFTLLLFTLIFIFGFLIVLLVFKNITSLEHFALSYLIGIGLSTYLVFAYGMVDHHVTGQKISLLVLSLDIVLILICIRLKKFNFKVDIKNWARKIKTLNMFEFLILLGILLLTVTVAINNYYWPASHWDSIALYDARARFFLTNGDINSMFPALWYFSYPLFTSIGHAIFYFTGAQNPMFIYTFLYISFIVCFYYLMRRNVQRTIALFFTFLLSVSYPIFSHAQISYTNLPYTVFLGLGFLYLYDWMIKKREGSFYASLLLIALSTWTRAVEPFWGVAIVVLLAFCIKNKKFMKFVLYAVFIMAFRYLWYFYQDKFSGFRTQIPSEALFVQYMPSSVPTLGLKKIFEILVYVWKNSILMNLNLLIACAISLGLNIKKYFWKKFYPAFFIISTYGMIVIGTFIFSIRENAANFNQLGDSLQRLSMIFIPLFLFLIAQNVHDALEK